jgi:predicted P-loop ATPase
MKDVNARCRAIERLIMRSHNPASQGQAAQSAGNPNWRERRENGSPIPSMQNARLAIGAVGVVCGYDTFHEKLLFGYMGATPGHVAAQIAGEVSDHGIINLRRLLSDRFGFDLTEKHVRDAVTSLALERRFDPVADMLAEAEANWDRVPRLDRMAADHLNCEDTPLNSACIRKTMIAAVARVRQPGCKFDTITVLESKEGWNKSGAWRTLAGAENFSDERIIGKESREVQEQLADVWIHENADLAGLTKAEVETVKAFASHQVDRARPAYGRFLKRQPRHSIEVGTTNSSEYLQSQTGNRRFWPMLVVKMIDLEKLKADRLQLWGEAAHYQSQGDSLTLDESMWSTAEAEQEKRRVKDPWEAVLADMPVEVEERYYDDTWKTYRSIAHRIIHLDVDQERVATADLLLHALKIEVKHQTPAQMMRLANVMKKLGWERPSGGKVTINGKRVQGYFRRV